MVVGDERVARIEAWKWVRRVNRPSWVDDATQEALVALWAAPHVPERHPVARNAIADAWRREHGRRMQRQEWLHYDGRDVDVDVEDEGFAEVDERLILSTVDLDCRDRAVLDCLVHQWRQAEIAETLGLHYSSVSLIVGRVRERIRASQI